MTLCNQLFEDIIINRLSYIVIVFDVSIASLEPVKLGRTCTEASFEILLANNIILYPNYSISVKIQQFIEYLSNLSSNYNVQVFRIQK